MTKLIDTLRATADQSRDQAATRFQDAALALIAALRNLDHADELPRDERIGRDLLIRLLAQHGGQDADHVEMAVDFPHYWDTESADYDPEVHHVMSEIADLLD